MRSQTLVSLASLLLLTLSSAPSVLANAADDAQQSPSPEPLSHARVVRLSFVKGTVAARRPGSNEWVRATLETPIEEGFSIVTTRGGAAELQFENGSTIRLAEFSRVDFVQLALAPHGGHVNHMTLDRGIATMNLVPERHDEYVLNVSGVSLTPHGKTEFRTDSGRDRLRVEVFKGHVLAADATQSEKLAKNHALAYNPAGGPFQVTAQIQKDAWDKWVQAREEQAILAAYGETVGFGDLRYAWESDLVPFGGFGLADLGDGF
jgi:ferric-dicitrate binding protein FerR (iron transport regulator)